MKTITIYELFGLMLKRQAPKKIEVLGFTMNYVKNAHWGDYEDEETHISISSFRLNECLTDEVKILEEEKKIPEKLDYCEENTFMIKCKENSYLTREEIRLLDSNFKELGNKINEIIDHLKSKGDE